MEIVTKHPGVTGHSPDIFALDTGWLRPLGLLRGPSLRHLDQAQRLELLNVSLKHQPFAYIDPDQEPASCQLISATSLASYDDKTGIFEYKLVYWRYLPEASAEQRANSDQHVISIRGLRSPDSKPGEVPEIIPDQIWFNGSALFTGPANGGTDDPHRPEFRRLLTRILELGKRVNEKLNNREPVHELGDWLAGEAIGENFSAKGLGAAPVLRGLNDKGWDPYQRVLDEHFIDLVQEPGAKVTFDFGPIAPLTPLDRLKGTLGYYHNTVEPIRMMHDASDEYAGDLQIGIGYLCSSQYEQDQKTGNHVFRVRIEPQHVPDDQTACEPFDLMELTFSQPTPTSFRLDGASFMGNGPDKSRNFSDAFHHVGLFQDINRALSLRTFPALNDLIARNRLQHLISEIRVPARFDETGGETLWISLFGTSMEKKVENYGDGIGGGNLFLQRGRKADGTVDEIAVLHGLPLEPGNSESDFDGMQPDIMRFREALRRGVILIDHIHFDHSTIEYYAAQIDPDGNGWLKGQKILCKAKDAFIMKDRLRTLGVRHDQWPNFIIFDSPDATKECPDLIKIPTGEDKDDYLFVYRVHDEDNNTRMWVQICKDGTLHSAHTDSYLITGCFNDDHYQDTYYIASDSVGLTKRGWEFAEKGQLALANLPGVSLDKLEKAARSKNELYIALEDPTGVNWDGHAPTFDESKRDLRALMKSLPDDHALVVFPFSTNELDIRAFLDVCSERETLRNVTAVGKNAETRLTAMNQFGVDDDLDLSKVVIPPEKLPQEAYEAVYTGVMVYIDRQQTEAEKKAKKRGAKFTMEDLLAGNRPYQIMKHIADEVERQEAAGQKKPDILFDTFLSGKNNALDAIAEQLGLPPATEAYQAPIDVDKYLNAAFERRRKNLETWKTDTAAFMLRSLATHGKVQFATNGSINDTFMYQAIMAGQKTAALRAVRMSKTAKNFRDDSGRLAVLSTGPIGSVEEFMASLSRFRRGDSLFDYDEVTRNTGYKLDPQKMTFLVMQTPSMGATAALAQEEMVQRTAYDRGITIHLCTHGGLRIVNPGANRNHYQQRMREQGWNLVNVGAKQDLFSPGHMIHCRGHRFYHDMVDSLSDERYKAKLVEVIHIPDWRAYHRMQEICARVGRPLSIKKPDTNIARRYREDKDGRPSMEDVDFLSEVYWLIKRRSKYGKQYGWMIDMIQTVSRARRGPERTGPLHIRTNGYVDEQMTGVMHNDWLKPWNGASSKLARLGPSAADVRPAGEKPMGPAAGTMLQKFKRKRRAGMKGAHNV